MAVTLTQLVAFLAVVRRGSVTAAAEELVVTQPSVSAAVAALERELGVALTERAGRTLRPTPAGAAYAPYAGDVLGLLEQGARAAREAAERGPRTLRISAVTTAGEFLLPAAHPGLPRAPPDLEISLDVGNRADVFQRLPDHEVDVAITGRVPEDGRLVGPPIHGQRVGAHHRARRPAGQAPLGRDGGAGRAAVARARAGLGHADAVRGLPREPRHRAARADARLQRRDQAGGARSVSGSRCSRARRSSSSSGSGCSRRSARAAGCRTGPGTSCAATTGPVREVDTEAFMAYCETPAARHALARDRWG